MNRQYGSKLTAIKRGKMWRFFLFCDAIKKTNFLLRCVLLAVIGVCVSGYSRDAAKPSIDALANRYVAIQLEKDPTKADSADIKDYGDKLPDLSPIALRRFNDAEDALWSQLARIPPESVSAADRPTYAVLKEDLIDDRGMRVCRAQLWDLNHMFGWQVEFPNLADSQPVDSPEDRAAALRRWASLPGYMRQETENLRTGLAQGYSAPKSVVNRVYSSSRWVTLSFLSLR